jgi:hypothetical protein
MRKTLILHMDNKILLAPAGSANIFYFIVDSIASAGAAFPGRDSGTDTTHV